MQTAAELRGVWRWLAPVLVLVAGGFIGIAGYYALIPFETRMWMRLILAAIFLAAMIVFWRNKPARETCLAFFAVSVGLYVAGLIGGTLTSWLGISDQDPRGFAINKINETLPIILVILLAVLLSRRKLSTLYLSGGRVGRSLIYGLVVGAALFLYFLSQGGWQVFQAEAMKTLLPMIGWMTIFSIFNGFMEELWFRGLFLSRFEWLLGRSWAFWITAITFGMLHIFGSFNGTLGTLLLSSFTVLLGIAFGYIVQKTNSIWGAVLGHFFADFFMMVGYFATMG
jgi:membrane protease YdiL (CAAX protease family)